MKKNCIRNFFKLLFLTFILMLGINNTCFASSEEITTYSPACILIDLNSDRILYSKNENEKMYPASTTKVMTAILTVENCDLDELATVSANAISSIPDGYTTANLQEGELLTIEQLLNVLLIHSANEAAVVLAEHIAGSVEAFSDMMNNKALELGCTNTHFVNPNGIHDENHYSTAYDLSLIGKYAMQFDEIKNIVSKTSYALGTTNKYDKTDRIFSNTNDLLHEGLATYYPYTTGLKTGYTDPAQSCIIASASKDDISLLCVVLHDERTEDGQSQRAIDCKRLFDYGFNSYSMQTIAKKDDVALDVTILNGTLETRSLSLLYQDNINALLPNDTDLSNISPTSVLKTSVFAPISAGDVIGTITYNIDGIDYSTNLIASHDVVETEVISIVIKIFIIIIVLLIFAKIVRMIYKKK